MQDKIEEKEYKILTLLDTNHGYFMLGILKKLSEIMNCKFYAIAIKDRTDYEFFKNQNVVKFEKLWYYPDYYNQKNKNPDISYLKEIESKLGENLWLIAYFERFFYHYYKYHEFTQDEILSNLEQTCKLYTTVFEHVKPDFITAPIADSGFDALFFKLAKSYGIKNYLFNIQIRFANRIWITDDPNGENILGKTNKIKINNFDEKEFDGLKELRGDILKDKKKGYFHSEKKASFMDKVQVFIKFLLSNNEKSFYELYQNYGKTKTKLIKKKILTRWNGYRTKKYLEKNSINNILETENFVYYPLGTEPEAALQMKSPFHTNQLNVIQNIAKALPVGFQLFVKEHIYFKAEGRSIEFYKAIAEMPNVKLVNPKILSDKLVEKAKLIITLTGSTGFDSLFFKKPVIVFDHVFYDEFSSVKLVKDINNLPELIRIQIEDHKFDVKAFAEFLENIKSNSVELNFKEMWYEIMSLTPYHKFKNPLVSEEEFQNLLEKFSVDFEILSKFLKQKIDDDLID